MTWSRPWACRGSAKPGLLSLWRDRRAGERLPGPPIEGGWPYIWLDATYVKVRRDHHIVSVAVIIAVGVNTDGRREVLGMTVGHSEAEPFWTEFLRSLTRRGLRGTRLVISDAHEGLKAAITKVLSATWQRCRVHFMRNALAHAGKTQRRIVSAWIGTAFAQDDAAAARKQWREVADQVRPRVPRLATLMDDCQTSLEMGPTISVQTGPTPAVAFGGQARVLMRQLSLPVSMMSQWCVSRSSSAVVILASPNTVGHSAKARLVVTITEVRS